VFWSESKESEASTIKAVKRVRLDEPTRQERERVDKLLLSSRTVAWLRARKSRVAESKKRITFGLIEQREHTEMMRIDPWDINKKVSPEVRGLLWNLTKKFGTSTTAGQVIGQVKVSEKLTERHPLSLSSGCTVKYIIWSQSNHSLSLLVLVVPPRA